MFVGAHVFFAPRIVCISYKYIFIVNIIYLGSLEKKDFSKSSESMKVYCKDISLRSLSFFSESRRAEVPIPGAKSFDLVFPIFSDSKSRSPAIPFSFDFLNAHSISFFGSVSDAFTLEPLNISLETISSLPPWRASYFLDPKTPAVGSRSLPSVPSHPSRWLLQHPYRLVRPHRQLGPLPIRAPRRSTKVPRSMGPEKL